MLDRVVSVLETAGVERIIVVAGYGREAVAAELARHHPDARIAVQEEQLGTGHAVRTALPLISGDAATIGIFNGDAPLLTPEIVRALTAEHLAHGAAVTLLAAELEDPTGYGRIVRTPEGRVSGVVEEKDATPQIRAIREINAGSYVFAPEALAFALERVRNDNAQGEYYLTDTIRILCDDGRCVAAVTAREDPAAVLGVNTVEQLMEAEALLAERER